MTARNDPATAVPTMTALLTHPSAKVPLGEISAGGPVLGSGEGELDGEGEEGAGEGTAVGDGDGEGTAGAGAGTGVGAGDGGVTTGAGVGLAVGETVGVAVGGCAMHEVVKTAINMKHLNIVEEPILIF